MTSAELGVAKAATGRRWVARDGINHVVVRTWARMIATLSWPPIGVGVFTAIAFLIQAEPPNSTGRLEAVVIGATSGLIVWLLLAALTNQSVLPERANLRSYFDLRARIAIARGDITRLAADDGPIERGIDELEERLSSPMPGPGWSSGVAYVSAWRDLHRIEEALIALEKHEHLWAIFAHDELRVGGSKLAKDMTLQAKMTEARERLEKRDYAGLGPLLGEIRYAVNDFRDAAFDTLVRARGTTERLCVLLGLTTCILLAIAILMNAARIDIALLSAVFLVGVAAGLITRLRNGSSGETGEDIYGYGQANDRQIILLSGLAAIAGVALSAASGAPNGYTDLTSKGIATAIGVTPAVFLTAAVSGLAPGVLIDRLNTWAKGKFDDLASTLPAQSGTTDSN